MNWNDLRFFLAVARHGGLTGAARQLGTSQSTVGRRIDALEAALGTRLFERRASGYDLSEAGRGMLNRAVAIEEGLVEMESEVSGQDKQSAGLVRIAAIETVANQIVIPQLPRFQARYPDLTLEFTIRPAIPSLLRESDITLWLCRPEQGAYALRRLGRLAVGLYASPDYLARHPVGDDEGPIAGHPLIGWSEIFSFVVMAQALRAWTRADRGVLVLDSVVAQLQAIKAGLGLGVLPCIVGDGDSGVVRIDALRLRQSEDLWMVVRKDVRAARRIRLVCDFLAEVVRQRQRDLDGVT